MLLGNMRISYDPNPPEKISRDTIMSRLNNSNIFLNTAFLTLGDLNKSPFYLSGGQMFVPFGEYDSSLLTASLPARLGRTKQRPIAIGFEPHFIPGFNASAFVFKGDAYVQKSSGVINNGGGNVSYTLTLPFLSLTTAGSYIVNIADSGGMQNTGPSTIVSDAGSQVDNSFLDEEDLAEDDIVTVNSFRGFGAQGFGKNTGESLVHRVPAYDLRAKLKLTHIPISFTGELINPTRSFDAANVSFNSNYDPDTDELQPASPSAWHVESGINFTAFNNPSSFIIGYGHSSDALTFNLPRATKGITVRTTFKKAVSVSIGYQVDTAYPAGSYGTGQGITTKSDNFVGTFSKTLSGQINAKF